MLGVRHQPHHVALRVHDARHVSDRTVRIPARLVAEHDLAPALELVEQPRGSDLAALAVLHGDDEPLADLRTAEVNGVSARSTRKADVAADEPQ